ncbi:MAG TPA: polysaccharide deacetylase family protein [Thermoanaerobaculia bacterium]|nr:polysaccharide deacetylase family protein [Thermoanaerobaculia bacterium]
MTPRLALKVDVDTFSGTCDGVPRLLELFGRHGVLATFFFSLGPDNTGKAIKRVLKKGFVKKVLRASPGASYGVRTMLSGTLLPARDIGASRAAVLRMREAKAAGHECGIHAWDHVDWHDRAARMGRSELEEIVAKAQARYADVFGESAILSAAPGWTATPLTVEIEEARGVRVSSNTRGGAPFHALRPDGLPSSTLEIPSTLPTLDELLALDEYGSSATARERTVGHLREEVRTGGPHVHSLHTEIEGGRALHPLFERQLAAWREDGVALVTLGELAAERLVVEEPVPVKALAWTTVPGRAIRVATQA